MMILSGKCTQFKKIKRFYGSFNVHLPFVGRCLDIRQTTLFTEMFTRDNVYKLMQGKLVNKRPLVFFETSFLLLQLAPEKWNIIFKLFLDNIKTL